MKIRNQRDMKDAFSLDTQKSFAEATKNPAVTVQSFYRKEEHTIVGKSFASTAKKPIRKETKNIQ